MEEDDLLPNAPFPLVDAHLLLASPVGQTVEAEQVAIAGLDNMLLSLVTEQSAYIYEVGGLCDCGGDPFFFTALAFILRSYK